MHSLAFARFFANFCLGLLIKALLIKKRVRLIRTFVLKVINNKRKILIHHEITDHIVKQIILVCIKSKFWIHPNLRLPNFSSLVTFVLQIYGPKKRTLRSDTFFWNWKHFKNDEKCLFHLVSFSRSQDISIFADIIVRTPTPHHHCSFYCPVSLTEWVITPHFICYFT